MASASALLAFQRGEQTDDGLIGGMVVSEHYADIRMIRQALVGKVDGE